MAKFFLWIWIPSEAYKPKPESLQSGQYISMFLLHLVSIIHLCLFLQKASLE